MDSNKILDKVKMKIAISNSNKEDIVMNKKEKFLIKNIGIAACVLISLTGVVFAGNKVIENIWKTPQKVHLSSNNREELEKITEESKKENISEEKAKEIAINKLNEIGFNSNIVGTNHYKEIDSNKIVYRFNTENNYEISINGQTGKFYNILNNNKDIQDRNKYMSEEQAKQLAKKYYKLFGFKEGEYEITNIQSVNNEGKDKGNGFRMTVTYNRKYEDQYNPFECINITLESKNMEIAMLSVENIPFDNNEVVITKNEAIDIALKEDKKINNNKIENNKTELMIVKMNTNAYDRINNNDKYYEAMQRPNYPIKERNYYNINERVRKAWVVVINYEDNYGENISKRYTEGKYSYFVDATTGEIIGGQALDYIYSESQK